MNNKLNIFLKEFLGLGILTAAALLLFLLSYSALDSFIRSQYGQYGYYYDSSSQVFPIYLLIAAIFYFFCQRIGIN